MGGDEVYQLRVVCEECDQEIGSVSLPIAESASGLFWGLQTASSQVGDLIKTHRARMLGRVRDGA